MSSDDQIPLAESAMTIPSDSEQYSGHDEISPSPPSSSSSPAVILYTPPTIWGLVRGAAINLLLPFINGLMLGFGELFAHEAAFRLGWGGTKVCALLFHYNGKTQIMPAPCPPTGCGTARHIFFFCRQIPLLNYPPAGLPQYTKCEISRAGN